MIFKNLITLLVCSLIAVCSPVFAQVYAPDEAGIEHDIARAEEWIAAGSFHTARIELEQLLAGSLSRNQKDRILFLLTSSSFADEDYDRAYGYSAGFLSANHEDKLQEEALYYSGVSAFHTGKFDESLRLLKGFLDRSSNERLRGSALY